MMFIWLAFRFLKPFANVGLYIGIALAIDLGLGLGFTDRLIQMAIDQLANHIGISELI